ncbi:MAG TPA: cytochrome c peroxidase [Planctomycetota bacterium]|nr:MAG: Cytochrome c551 peroxidase precursor [Planctomycetes bacterium ADurb.Bin069]HNR99058.1 cytochrome c peroxidase [Planctomycetota bacterium]HNU26249.1 cytochrome c peroxidase [Planctomycetota bacterium]HOE30776.1 cytochrome c peroxidase [Planctomycetota bacterium]HOE87862.1 cytochrome c peroxidase [Planctomycetota bacterium]
MECTKAPRRGTAAAMIGTLAVMLACAAGADGAQPREIPRDQFGAAHAAFQEAELAKLLPAGDVTKAPAGFDPVIWEAFIPEDNAQTPERVELGRKLYFDTRLSLDNTVSCATCHDVTRGFTDQLPVSVGIKNQLGRRNAPTVVNTALLQTLFLDGRSPTLEHQAKLPIVNPIEMGMPDGETAVKAIKDDAEYRAAFKKAYGREVNHDDIGRALAAFERTLVFIDSPFRRFLAGDTEAISPEAQEGWELFNEKARCVACHPISQGNPLGTDNRFHNIGVSARHQDFEKLAIEALKALRDDPSEEKLDELALTTDMSELGRFMVSKQRGDIGAFRTSMLLNVGITAPYMHDGSIATLWDVLDHYNKGGEPNLFLDGGIEALALTEPEIDRLVAFLFTLTDVRFAEDNAREFARQKARAEAERPLRDNAAAFRKKLWQEK